MRRPIVFALGVTVGSLAYPLGRVLGQALFNHSVIYPHAKEN